MDFPCFRVHITSTPLLLSNFSDVSFYPPSGDPICRGCWEWEGKCMSLLPSQRRASVSGTSKSHVSQRPRSIACLHCRVDCSISVAVVICSVAFYFNAV